jgi:flagellar hook-associated protein 2
MAGLSVGTGLGSGLPIQDLADQLRDAQRAPFDARFERQQTKFTTQLSGFGILKSAMEKLKSSVDGLKDADDYLKRKASASQSDFLSVTSSKEAIAGSYDISVDQLAQSAKYVTQSGFAETEALGAGTVSLTLGSDSFDITLDADDTLEDLRDAINSASDNVGIDATIITDSSGQRLIFNSETTGQANDISIAVTDGDTGDGVDLNRLASLDRLRKAEDAQITVDGVVNLTSDTNTFDEVVDGVDITVKKVQTVDDEDTTISVSLDKNNIKTQVQSLINAYNEMKDTLASISRVSTTVSDGALAGDSTPRLVDSQIRRVFQSAIEGATTTLTELGVTSTKDGKFELDSGKLDEVIDNDFSAVSTLFAGDNGLANKLSNTLDNYTKINGLLDGRIDTMNNNLEKLREDKVRIDVRMESYRKRILDQFITMDSIVGSLTSTGNYLQGQFDNLPGVVKQNN